MVSLDVGIAFEVFLSDPFVPIGGRLARVAGPLVAGLAYKYLNNTGQFLLAAIIAFLTALWLMAIRRPAPEQA